MTVTEILWNLAGPFGLVFVVLTALWRPWRSDVDTYAAWPLPVVLAAGYVVGHVSISSFPAFPAVTAEEWLVYLVIGAGAWGVVEAVFDDLPRLVLYTGRLAVFGVGFGMMFGDHLGIVALGGLLAATLIWVAALDGAMEAGEGGTTLWAVAIVAGAAGGIFVLGSTLKLALLSWALMAMVAAVLVVSTNTNSRLRLQPALCVIGVLIIGLFVTGVLFARVPFESAVVAALALVIPLGIGAVPKLQELAMWKMRIAQFALAIAIAGMAVGYAHYETNIAEEVVDEDSDEYDPYSW